MHNKSKRIEENCQYQQQNHINNIQGGSLLDRSKEWAQPEYQLGRLYTLFNKLESITHWP